MSPNLLTRCRELAARFRSAVVAADLAHEDMRKALDEVNAAHDALNAAIADADAEADAELAALAAAMAKRPTKPKARRGKCGPLPTIAQAATDSIAQAEAQARRDLEALAG